MDVYLNVHIPLEIQIALLWLQAQDRALSLWIPRNIIRFVIFTDLPKQQANNNHPESGMSLTIRDGLQP